VLTLYLYINMMPGMRYEHDIKKYAELRNQGLSWRDIGKQLNINHSTLTQWIERNYIEVVKYKYKQKLN